MTGGEVAYLLLAIGGMVLFGVTVFWASRSTPDIRSRIESDEP